MSPERPAGPDVLALVIVLGRLGQTTSELLIKLVEHQSGAGEFPRDSLRDLAAQLTWVSDTIKRQLAELQ